MVEMIGGFAATHPAEWHLALNALRMDAAAWMADYRASQNI